MTEQARITAKVIDRLFTAAAEAHVTALEATMHASGLLWQCGRCFLNNPEHVTSCESCSAERGKP